MHKLLKFFLSAAVLSLSNVCAAHDHSYATGGTDDVPWLSGELLGPGVSVGPYGKLVGTTTAKQIGWFSNLVSEVASQFANGVILSTGNIAQGATITNLQARKSWEVNEAMNDPTTADQDSDLARSADVWESELGDVSGIVLYVIPQNKTINIPFMMASEEFFHPSKPTDVANYNLPALGSYNEHSDKFAFFLKEGEIKCGKDARDMGFDADDDIARLPDGSMVEIASVNQYTNQAYFVANVVTNGPNDQGKNELDLVFPTGDMPIPMEYNGAIIGPTAVCTNVVPGKTYTIKIVISDHNDRFKNSVIFLKAHGITSGNNLAIDVSGPAILSDVGVATFTNTVMNLGPISAEGVVVTNYLPVGVKYDDVQNRISHDAGEIVGSGTTGDGTDYFVWSLGNDFASGSNAVMTVTCDLENPGTYTNRALVVSSYGDFDESNNEDFCETVVASPETRPITIKVKKLTKMYDGTPLKADYETEGEFGAGDTPYVTFDIESITDACETETAVKVKGCVISNGIEDVTAKYTIVSESGSLKITRRDVTLTSKGATKTYDGKPLENHEDPAVGGNGFADNEGVESYEFTGSQTMVGKSDNEFTYKLKDDTKESNYDINCFCGPLEVTRIETPITISVTGAQRKYNRSALTEKDASVAWTEDVIVDGDTVEVTLTDASITDVGTSNVTVKAYKVMHGETDVTKCYNFGNSTTGTLEILRRGVTLTSASAEKPYDGTPLTTNKVEVSGDGFVDPEGATYKVTGSRTDVGESANVFSYGLQDNTKPVNYNITCVTGTLQVTKVVTPITITVDRLTRTYNRQPLKASWKVEGNLVGSDKLIVTPSIESITNVGSNDVTVTCKVMRGTADVTADYKFTINSGSLEVTKAPLTIKAPSNTKKYGTPTAFSKMDYTITDGTLFDGDKITQVILASKGCDKAAPYLEEGYSIEVKKVMGSGLENYYVKTVDGVLKVERLPLTITVANTNKVYGTEVNFAGTEFLPPEGLINGDTVTNVTLTSEGAAKDAAWKEGGYEIKGDCPVDGKGAGNYTITFLPGTLTVDKRKITITAGDTNKVYGTEIELDQTAFEITEGDLADGDTVTEVTLTSEGATEGAEYQEEGYPIVPSHDIMGNIETNNYDIVFSNGTLTVKKAELTIAVEDVKWRIGKERPDNSFSISPDQLKAGDTVEQITGGSVTYTNAVWTEEHPKPTYTDKGKYENEIWIDLSLLSGTRSKNYDISVDPGTLEIASAEVKFEVALSGEENGLGVQELTLTITNKGDPIDADYDYWVELMPGTNETGKLVYCICKGMSVSSDWKFSPIRTAKMGDGSDYVNLTDEVTNALWTVVGNRDGVFGMGEVVTITGISFYHSDVSGKRHDIMSVLDGDASSFIKAGKLFNVADVNKDFIIDDDEKADAGWLLGESIADYLEVTRLALLRYYHWDAKEGTWIGPSK